LEQYQRHNNDVNDPRYMNFIRPLVDLICDNQKTSQNGFDFETGPGPLITKILAERGFSMQLYDPFFHSDILVLEAKYDLVVTCEVIEHYNNPRTSFERLSGLLALNGSLFCRTTQIPYGLPFSKWHYTNDATHVFF